MIPPSSNLRSSRSNSQLDKRTPMEELYSHKSEEAEDMENEMHDIDGPSEQS